MIEAICIHRVWTVNCFFCFIPSLLISRITAGAFQAVGLISGYFRLMAQNISEYLQTSPNEAG